MNEWLTRLFKLSAGGRSMSEDGAGGNVRQDRRACPRKPFSGRPEMTEEDFGKLALFVSETLGIRLESGNSKLLESRLMNRLRTLNMGTFREYSGYLMSERGLSNELENFINAVTTGKTHFWREPGHFEFIIRRGADELLKTRSSLRAWSAGCSTGEEPYTIAMALAEHAGRSDRYSFSVIGSDISEQAIGRAEEALYGKDSVMNMPEHIRNKYLIREGDSFRITPGIRNAVTIKRINLLNENYGIANDIDMAFFRNVGIYFGDELRKKIIGRICRHITPGGYLFLGHSERLEGLGLPLELVEGTVYRKAG